MGTVKKLKVAILGTGNIGTDLLVKCQRSEYLTCTLFAGRNLNSIGMTKAANARVKISDRGLEALERDPDGFDLVFDATSAAAHKHNWPVLERMRKMVIDMTPSDIGKRCVPAINLAECLDHGNINMVTCGGQASIPIAHVIGQTFGDVEYIEVVSSIASRSAGPATRINLDEYIDTTEGALAAFSGAKRAKAILILNPAVPCIDMQTTIFTRVRDGDLAKLIPAVEAMVGRISRYVPGYRLVVPPVIEGERLVVMVKVTGLGDFLPSYAGNLDIINCAAIAAAEEFAKTKHAVQGDLAEPGEISMTQVTVSDSTLRDGNHAVRHKLTIAQIERYCQAANDACIPIVEVGHGNGIGASSLQVGEADVFDWDMLETARAALTHSRLGVHIIPGFATIKRDVKAAIAVGVDVFRVGVHCTEADVTQRHIDYIREQGKTPYGVLMMSHMASPQILVEEACKMQSYGAEGVVIMDSSGNYMPADVTKRIGALAGALSVPVGFHAHNNLGMAIANSLAAVHAGATIIDGCARGFGAGAGNAQLEILVAVFQREGIETGIDMYKALDLGDIAESAVIDKVPIVSSISIASGMAGVFSGFVKHVQTAAKEYDVDARDIFFELGRRKIVAGQEDIIVEVALSLSRNRVAN